MTFNPNPYTDTTVDNATIPVTVKTYGYVFKKVDEAGKALKGATFTLRLSNGKTLTSTSDDNGYVSFEDLAVGDYTVEENGVPSGYQKTSDLRFTLNGQTAKSDNPATANIAENNYAVSQQDVVDKKLPTLPVTGAAGITLMVLAGIALLGGGSALIIRSSRKVARS